MKFFKYMKDGGPESKVSGFFLVEIKGLFSIALLRFADGSREAFHSHAFNCVSWVLWGALVEKYLVGWETIHRAGWRPIITRRSTFHKVRSIGTTWVLTFRGPWTDRWMEYLPSLNRFVALTHGRRVVP